MGSGPPESERTEAERAETEHPESGSGEIQPRSRSAVWIPAAPARSGRWTRESSARAVSSAGSAPATTTACAPNRNSERSLRESPATRIPSGRQPSLPARARRALPLEAPGGRTSK
nr:hypothetical protein KitaXyl93_63940 [Kitasatospora sp. Xyl93]